MLQFSKVLVKYSWGLFFAGFGVYTIYVRSPILGCPVPVSATRMSQETYLLLLDVYFGPFTGYIKSQVPQVTLGRDC